MDFPEILSITCFHTFFMILRSEYCGGQSNTAILFILSIPFRILRYEIQNECHVVFNRMKHNIILYLNVPMLGHRVFYPINGSHLIQEKTYPYHNGSLTVLHSFCSAWQWQFFLCYLYYLLFSPTNSTKIKFPELLRLLIWGHYVSLLVKPPFDL